MVFLYAKMCRIKFQQTFKNNVGVLDLPEKAVQEKQYKMKNFEDFPHFTHQRQIC